MYTVVVRVNKCDSMTFGPKLEAGARITSLDEYKKHLDHFMSPIRLGIVSVESRKDGPRKQGTRRGV